ncbi:hypothetical protein CR513_60750, partial [Mucuna pruriens]
DNIRFNLKSLLNQVLDVFTKDIQKIIHNCMPFVDDISREGVNFNLSFRINFGNKSFCLSRRKTDQVYALQF